MNHIALSLRDIFFNKRTGRLVYKRGDVQKYFFFQKGTLIQVKTNVAEERLGEVLYKLERISKDAHSTMDQYVEPNQSIGEVLRSRGVISEQDLSDALTYQLRETALNVFPYFDAEITFQERDDSTTQTEESKISIPFIIEYGIRRMQPNPNLKEFLARQVLFLKRKSFAYLLTVEEKEILDRITGADPAEAILRTLTSPPDFFWKSLYLFYCLDLVDVKKEEEGQAAKSAGAAETASGGTKMTPEIADVLAFREAAAQKSFYQILGVGKTASEEEIKKAYFQMARRFHPDRFERKAAAEYKNQIDEVFDRITNAYRVLSNKDKRKDYDSGIATGAQEEGQDSVKKAEIKFRQGKTLFGTDRFDDAVSYLEEAVRLRQDKADYYLLLAMAESKIPSYLRKAESDFLKAISLEPWNPEAYVGLGVLYRAEGLQTKAIRQFEKALEADREHAKARQELMDMGVGQKKKKGLEGFFSLDFLGSKGKKKKK
ncbi:MAG: DnaJ domain-containing protein [Candidatus Aminicenantales bacterium]|jgi:curved DNA-binding protein CbpA